MLEAIITFVGFALTIYWWGLVKQFRQFRKGERPMSVILFVVYCILSLVILDFFLSLFFTILTSFLPNYYKHQIINMPEVMFGVVFIIVAAFVSFQCYLYVKVARKSNLPISKEDVDLGID